MPGQRMSACLNGTSPVSVQDNPIFWKFEICSPTHARNSHLELANGETGLPATSNNTTLTKFHLYFAVHAGPGRLEYVSASPELPQSWA